MIGAALQAAQFTSLDRRRPEEFLADSSTAASFVDPALLRSVKSLFAKGASEVFYDGMESQFSRAFLEMLDVYGNSFLSAVSEYLFSDEGKPEVVSEALRWLADVGAPTTLSKRWSMLRHGLKSASPVVREGAILGFAALDDPRALDVLLEARNREHIKELRVLIEHVAARLSRPR
jgi:HEAT repeat protein